MLYSPIVPEPVVEIPNRPAFRASEVCELAQIPAYVLKSWEKEFPGLGIVPKPGAPRVYRRADVEQVVRIKHLLFAEGLTLSGARRKLEGEPKIEDEPLPELPVAGEVRDKVARIKQELRSLLDLLSSTPPARASAVTPDEPASDAAAGKASVEDTQATAQQPDDSPRPWPPVPQSAAAGDAPGHDSEPELPLLSGVAEDSNLPKTRRAPRRPRRASDAP